VKLASGNATIAVTLHVSPLALSAVTVTAKPQPADILNSAQPVNVLEGRQLDQRRGQAIIVPGAIRGKFRKMAASAFAFCRG
jgi:hypothetical protein